MVLSTRPIEHNSSLFVYLTLFINRSTYEYMLIINRAYSILKKCASNVLSHGLSWQPQWIPSPELCHLAVEHFKVVLHLPLGECLMFTAKPARTHHCQLPILMRIKVARGWTSEHCQMPRVLFEICQIVVTQEIHDNEAVLIYFLLSLRFSDGYYEGAW